MLRFSLLLAVILALVATAASAAGVTSPPLAGETLTGTPPTVVASNCNETGTSTFTYTVTGVATGPYPGTFEETVTATIGPQTEPSNHPLPVKFGQVVQLTARFTIVSPVGTVTGTKTLLPSPFPTNQHGICNDEAADVPAPPGCSALFFQADTPVTYRASIASSLGSSTDGGTAFISSGGIQTQCGTATSTTGAFVETFLLSTGPLLPTTKDACKNGGWEPFGVFKNQGDCVAFVETAFGNEPGQNIPNSR